jgi:hypothetical protein
VWLSGSSERPRQQQRWLPPLVLLVALVNAQQHGARAPSYDAHNGRSKWVEHLSHLFMSGLAAMLRRLAEGAQAAANPGRPPAMDVIAAR